MVLAIALKDRRLQRIIGVLTNPEISKFLDEPTLRLFQLRYWLCGTSPMKTAFNRAGACFGAAHLRARYIGDPKVSFAKILKIYLRDSSNAMAFNASFYAKNFQILAETDPSAQGLYFGEAAIKQVDALAFYIESRVTLTSRRQNFLEDDVKHFIDRYHKGRNVYGFTKIKQLWSVSEDKALFCAAAKRVAPWLVDHRMYSDNLLSSHFTNQDIAASMRVYFGTCASLALYLNDKTSQQRLSKLAEVEPSAINSVIKLSVGSHISFKNEL